MGRISSSALSVLLAASLCPVSAWADDASELEERAQGSGSELATSIGSSSGEGAENDASASAAVADDFQGDASDKPAEQANAAEGSESVEQPLASETTSRARATAADVSAGDVIILENQGSGRVVEIAAGSSASGANAQQYADNNTPAQRYRVEDAGDGLFYLVNVASGKALDVAAGNASAGANVQQYDRNGTPAQKWALLSADGGTYAVSALSADPFQLEGSLVLDVESASASNGANVQLYTYNGTAAQRYNVRAIGRTVADGLYEIGSSVAAGKTLDIAAGSLGDGANAQIYASNGSAAQRYRLAYDAATGYYRIEVVASGKVLDVAGASMDDGANVQQYTANGSSAQMWSVEKRTGGTYAFRSGCSGKLLDVAAGGIADGTNVQQYAGNGTAAQSWSLTAVGQRTVADGLYEFSSALSSALVLDVAAASSDDGANVQLWTSNGTMAQKFEIAFDEGTGYYRVSNANSGKMLDVAAGAASNGANVQQYASNGTMAQFWSVEASGSGYVLRSARSGLVLDVSSGQASAGANVQTWTANGTAAQWWTLVETRLIDDGVYEIRSALGTTLDAAGGGGAPGTNVQAYAANGTLAQKYQVSYAGDGCYTLECVKSGLVLDVDSGVGPNVQLYTANGSDAQLWRPVALGGGAVAFVNKATGKALDIAAANASSGANVQVYTQNGSNAQKWVLTSTDSFTEGLYTVSSALDAGMVLDIANGSISNGAGLQLYEANGTAAQKFRVESVGDDLYRIVCLGSGKSLDVRDSAIDATTGAGAVQQWESWDTAAQLWRFEYAGDGQFIVHSALGGGSSCLDVSAGQAANGTSVGVRAGNGTAAQRFTFSETGSISSVSYSITLDEMVEYQREGNPYLGGVSDAALRAALEPSTNGTDLYQFVDLRVYSGLTGGQLNGYIARNGSDGVLSGMGDAFVAAAKEYGLNEAYLVAHTCLESGWGKSDLAVGTYYDGEGYYYTGTDGNTYWASLPGYPAGTYYNLFGIGAYDSDPDRYGVEMAIRNGWSSVGEAIRGAASWISANYVYRSSYQQVTLYDMKWDVAESAATHAYGWHQYATDVRWARNIASLVASCYSSAGVASPSLSYLIPSYA